MAAQVSPALAARARVEGQSPATAQVVQVEQQGGTAAPAAQRAPAEPVAATRQDAGATARTAEPRQLPPVPTWWEDASRDSARREATPAVHHAAVPRQEVRMLRQLRVACVTADRFYRFFMSRWPLPRLAVPRWPAMAIAHRACAFWAGAQHCGSCRVALRPQPRIQNAALLRLQNVPQSSALFAQRGLEPPTGGPPITPVLAGMVRLVASPPRQLAASLPVLTTTVMGHAVPRPAVPRLPFLACHPSAAWPTSPCGDAPRSACRSRSLDDVRHNPRATCSSGRGRTGRLLQRRRKQRRTAEPRCPLRMPRSCPPMPGAQA